ncbi:SulP family inorganic anion transporter [Derxia gummosa]|uniref:SulP family inorganic anion transporter n=1 Tax=Derxia gummosa DSM 723 TaxID=1121388 RepID=A0A8B6X1A3_9BURK|nr:SulP family inorganic anion transporter [Derxia gummosa]
MSSPSAASWRFRPRLIDNLAGYSLARFGRDCASGATVAVVALPLAMAFGIASGVTPDAGLFTAIIAGLCISALGGSRVQIGGPAGAFIVVVFGIIQQHGLANLLIATMLAGLLLFAMGALRLGNLIRFIPVSVVIGFTNGIAVLIALSQFKDLLGLAIPKMPGEFFEQLHALWAARASFNPWALAVASGGLAIMFTWPKPPSATALVPRWRRFAAMLPAPLAVLVATTTAVWLLDIPVSTIGSRFGGIPQALPAPDLPEFHWATVRQLFGPIVTIALLCAIESLLCARVADGLLGEHHDPNQELMAQGVANFVTPLFGGIPATGTIARTLTNVRAGATSPVAGIAHALFLLVIVLVAAPLAAHVPLAGLAAILLFVAWNMGEWREFVKARAFSNNYRIILVSTFLLTVVLDLSVAVEVGLVLSAAFFITRVASLTEAAPVELTPDESAYGRVAACRLYGSLFFGSVGKVEALSNAASARVVIVDLTRLINLDTTGAEALREWLDNQRRAGGDLVLFGANPQPRSLIERSGLLAELGADHLQPDRAAALALAWKLAGADGSASATQG